MGQRKMKRGVGIGAEEDEERSGDWGRGESSRYLASCDVVIPERHLTRREEGEERVWVVKEGRNGLHSTHHRLKKALRQNTSVDLRCSIKNIHSSAAFSFL